MVVWLGEGHKTEEEEQGCVVVWLGEGHKTEEEEQGCMVVWLGEGHKTEEEEQGCVVVWLGEGHKTEEEEQGCVVVWLEGHKTEEEAKEDKRHTVVSCEMRATIGGACKSSMVLQWQRPVEVCNLMWAGQHHHSEENTGAQLCNIVIIHTISIYSKCKVKVKFIKKT